MPYKSPDSQIMEAKKRRVAHCGAAAVEDGKIGTQATCLYSDADTVSSIIDLRVPLPAGGPPGPFEQNAPKATKNALFASFASFCSVRS